MSVITDPAVDTEFTTADYALMAATGNFKPANAKKPEAGPSGAAHQGGAAPNPNHTTTTTTKTKAAKPANAKAKAKGEQVADEPRSLLMNAATWCPGDFAALPPASLSEHVSAHQKRSQAMASPVGRFVHGLYVAPATAVGIGLNVLSFVTAKLSALINDPRHATNPGSLTETVTLHTARAQHIAVTPAKVLYTVAYAAPATAAGLVLNTVAWIAAQAAVAVNDPRRLGRVFMAVLFVALVAGGVVAVA